MDMDEAVALVVIDQRRGRDTEQCSGAQLLVHAVDTVALDTVHGDDLTAQAYRVVLSA